MEATGATEQVYIVGATDIGPIHLTSDIYSFDVQGYSPNVPRLKTGATGGLMYEEVIDDLPLLITAPSRIGAKKALHDLIVAIEQSERWAKNEDVDAVRLQWVGGDGQTLEAYLAGFGDQQIWMNLPPTYRVHLNDYAIGPLTVSVKRGVWLGPPERPSTTTDPISVTSGASFAWTQRAQHFSPVSMSFTVDGAPTYIATIEKFYIVSTSASPNFIWVEPTATGAPWTSQSDSTARNGTVLRFTPAGSTTENSITSGTIGSFTNTAHVFVCGRANTQSFTGRVGLNDEGGVAISTPTKTFTTSADESGVQYMGLVHSANNIDTVGWHLTASSAGAGHYDLDWILLVDAGDVTTNILEIELPATGTQNVGEPLEILNNPCQYRSPIIRNAHPSWGDPQRLGYWGSALPNQIGTNLYLVVIGGGNLSNMNLYEPTGSSPANLNVTLERRRVHLAPT